MSRAADAAVSGGPECMCACVYVCMRMHSRACGCALPSMEVLATPMASCCQSSPTRSSIIAAAGTKRRCSIKARSSAVHVLLTSSSTAGESAAGSDVSTRTYPAGMCRGILLHMAYFHARHTCMHACSPACEGRVDSALYKTSTCAPNLRNNVHTNERTLYFSRIRMTLLLLLLALTSSSADVSSLAPNI